MIKNNYAIDVGYGNIKGVSVTKRIIFPTLYKHFYNTIDQDLRNLKYIAKINNKQYSVGDFAAIGGSSRELSKDHQLDNEKISVFLGTALNLLSESCDETEEINLSVGLPVDFYMSQKDVLKNMLNGLEIKTEINGNIKNFIINEVLVTQQAVSAFHAIFLNPDGSPKNNQYFDREFYQFGGAIVDIGYNTLDLIRISKQGSNFVIVPEEKHSYEMLGAVFAHQIAAKEINHKFGCDYDMTFYEDALNQNNGLLYISGQAINIKPFFDNAYSVLADEIKRIVLKTWRDIDSFGGLYLTGGTAEKIIEHFNIRNVKIQLQDDSIFANALGLLTKLNLYLDKQSKVSAE